MNAFVETANPLLHSSQLAALCVDAWLKSVVVLALAGGVCLGWQRASAATRHLIWFLAVSSLPFLPLLSAVVPTGPRPLWSVSGSLVSGNQISLALELAPVAKQQVPLPAANLTTAANPTPATPLSGGSGLLAARFSQGWLAVVFVGWGTGILLACAYFVVGFLQLRKISRTARPLESLVWASLLQQACQTLDLRRSVVLLQSSENVMPLTWGWRRAVVLLPSGAEQWTEERRQVVLLHELAHIKRWDCLTQVLARLVCALFWCNPLVWLAARRMCIERERACDDLVLNGGCKASDYATQLVEIARSFRRAPLAAAIAMARPSGLEARVTAIVDASRTRHLRPVTLATVLAVVGAILVSVGGCKTLAESGPQTSNSLRQQQIAQLEAFSRAKEKQAKTLAEAEGQQIGPDYQRLFDAATRGNVNAVTNLYADFYRRHGQYEHSTEVRGRILPHTAFWSPVLEVCLAYDHIANCDPKYTRIAVHDIISSIPRGSIYFGGTDPGRGLPTAFSKSQIDADPFYTLTQNALADGSYLDYLRMTYGEESKLLSQFIKARHADTELRSLDADYDKALEKLNSLYANTNYALDGPEIKEADEAAGKLKQQADERAKDLWIAVRKHGGNQPAKPTIYTPTAKDSQTCFEDYVKDATERLHNHQLKPGENVKEESNGRIAISGQVAVMSINGLMTKIIFDKNPGHEFYVEESFPLDWMFPHLEPHGLILKINREPLSTLADDVIRKDDEYWKRLVGQMVGDWLTEDTPVQTVAEFTERIYLRKDLSGFKGDPNFVRDNYAPKMFSKWRSDIGGVYAWRLGLLEGVSTPPEYLSKNDAERQRMANEADFAYRQAFALCPYSPEAVFRYVNFLTGRNRKSDALVVAKTASHVDPRNEAFQGLVKKLKENQLSE